MLALGAGTLRYGGWPMSRKDLGGHRSSNFARPTYVFERASASHCPPDVQFASWSLGRSGDQSVWTGSMHGLVAIFAAGQSHILPTSVSHGQPLFRITLLDHKKARNDCLPRPDRGSARMVHLLHFPTKLGLPAIGVHDGHLTFQITLLDPHNVR